MAFSRSGLAKLGTANSDAGTMWLYSSTADAYAAIGAADYFLEAINEMKLGDRIIVRDSANVQTLSYVSSNDGTTIDIATGLTVTA